MFLLIVLAVLGLANAYPSGAFPEPSFSVDFNTDTFVPPADITAFIMPEEGKFVNMEVDGVTAESTSTMKKREKLPMMKRTKKEFPAPLKFDELPSKDDFNAQTEQPGVAPKLSISTEKTEEKAPEGIDLEYFNFGESSPAVANPAATHLEGGDFDKIQAPQCRMSGCYGPVPNDENLNLESGMEDSGAACHQAFVPMNGCTDNKGYPMGMICSICCDCTADFVREMKKTTGYLTNYKP